MQHTRHIKACQLFKEIGNNPQNYLIIHYSCESFYDIQDGHTPRITSIAVYDYATAQTDSFSIHKMAEKAHVEMKDIASHHDELERAMLDEFFSYAKEHGHVFWIHWSMRDMNYGFKAIEHRYSVLGGTPYKIPDEKKVDLSRLLIHCYGDKYTEHPRMETLFAANDVNVKDYLNGKQEAAAFSNHEYVKLHMSTLRKVDAFASVLNLAIDNRLKVQSTWSQIHGFTIQGFLNYCKETWWIQIIWTFVSMVLGALIGIGIERLL